MRNQERITAALAESPCDALIAGSPENFYYTAGTRIVTQVIMDDRPALAIWPKDGAPQLLVCSTEVFQVRQESWIDQIHTYVYRESPMAALAALLKAMGLSRGLIGLETRWLSLANGEELQRALPLAHFVDCSELLASLRMIKSPAEIARLRQAAAAADRAILRAFRFAAPGKTEQQVAAVLQSAMIEQGAETVPFLVVATGSRSGLAHPTPGLPTDRVLEPGDLVRVDVGGNFGFYWSDNMRTAVVGRASSAQRDRWRQAWDTQQAIIEAVKPGIMAGELFEVGRVAYRRAGVEAGIRFVGHGLGLSIHEPPVLEAGNRQVLCPGMVLCIETDVWPSATEAYDTEDQVLITEDGYEILSRTYDWQPIFETGG